TRSPRSNARSPTSSSVASDRSRENELSVLHDDDFSDGPSGLDEGECLLRLSERERPVEDRNDGLRLEQRADLPELGAVGPHEEVLEVRVLLAGEAADLAH